MQNTDYFMIMVKYFTGSHISGKNNSPKFELQLTYQKMLNKKKRKWGNWYKVNNSISFSTPFLTNQKCPTMLPHQEAITYLTSSLIWGFKEFTPVVESPTRPWSSLSCFEATPSIQVSISQVWVRYNVNEMSDGKMSVGPMLVGQMSVGQMSVAQVSVGKM